MIQKVYCRLIIIWYCLQLQSFMYLSGILATHLPKIMAECKAYKEKAIELFTPNNAKEISLNHLYKNIIVNPKALFNLVESNFLLQKKTENRSLYYELKTQILNFIKFLIYNFPLNAILIYEDPYLVVSNNKRINLVTYLIKDVRQAFLWQINSSAQQKQIFKKYNEVYTALFYSFCSICTLKTSQLKLISNTLTDFYYGEKLYTNLIRHNFELFSTGLRSSQRIPFISFIDNCKDNSISLQVAKGIWPFSKGLTSLLWINPHKCSEFQLLKLRSGLGEELLIKVQGSRLAISTISLQGKHEQEIIEINPLSDGKDIAIGIELQPTRGIFNNSFHLNVKIDQNQYLNLSSKIPSFQNCEMFGSYHFLNYFIGKFYGTIIASVPILNKWDQLAEISNNGVYNQASVKEFLDTKLIDRDEIVAIFNPQRFCQGKLINYINNGHFAYSKGRVFEPSYHNYASKLIDIYLPFLYFTSIIKEKNEESYNLFDKVFRTVLQIITKQNYETESVLLLLYFLEINEYKISQQTWSILYNHYTEKNNFYLNFVIKFIDIQGLVRNGIQADQELQPFSDPVERLIFMFHLETKWKELWNELQGFQGWWSPSFFQPQNDKAFSPQDFVYSPNREDRVQWSVLNLVTKDYCKSFVEPVFILPKYALCQRYQREYNQKQCFSSNFFQNLNQMSKNMKMVFKKISNSKFDKFKSKFLGKRQPNTQNSTKKKGQQVQIKQFQSGCIFIDILTVVQGSISIHKQGFITFHSSHKGKDFDHMCAKAFKNETFYYYSIPFTDIKEIYKKRFNASNNAAYIKTQDGKQMLFHFHLKNVDTFLNILQNFVRVKKDAFSNYVNSNQPLRWIDKFMSNYEYLQWLNEIAGRNYNDITQYPVLPWVYVADDEAITEQPTSNTHRDLSKNIGSHGDQSRIKQFLEKYQNVNEEQLFSEYHFGTHYSSSAIIFNFLIRIRPYSVGALAMQSGKFDCADRIFHSYCGSWKNASTSTTDIRELIPEIYTLPQMFINKNNYYYGVTQDKEQVDNAALPRWARGNPYYFVTQIRKQLQKRYVSQNINHWIDLIYGYKQRGKDAIEHMNIFYPLTYENCIDLDQVTEKNERVSFQTQIAHFGQNPSQIIGNNPHPTRKAIKGHWQDKLVTDDGSRLLIQSCFLNNEDSEQQSLVFNSVFEGKNAVLGVKFIDDTSFFVMRRNEYYLFQTLNKIDFLSKEQYVEIQPEQLDQASFNYKQISSFTPIAAIDKEVVIVGGYYNGFVSIVFLKEPKYNKNFQFHNKTVTALNYDSTFQTLFVGDVYGYLNVYRVSLYPKHVQFQFIKSIKAYDNKINDITINTNANVVCTCSDDGFANIYNLYSHKIIRTFRHPSHLPIHFAHITTNPLYAVVFYSKENSTVYTYSINGQFLDSVIEKTGFIYNMSIIRSTDSTQCLVYMNCQKELFIWELPFLKLKRKVKIIKDQNKISCLQACNNGKIIITGSEDGCLQIIANPQSY